MRKEIVMEDRCNMQLGDFSFQELVTGQCRWDSVCECVGGCPLQMIPESDVEEHMGVRFDESED